MFKQLLGIIGTGVNSTVKTFTNSFKTIDNIIEGEYITGTIDKAKSLTGEVVEHAGKYIELGKMKVEELKDQSYFKPIGEVIDNYKDSIEDATVVLTNKIDNITEIIKKNEEE